MRASIPADPTSKRRALSSPKAVSALSSAARLPGRPKSSPATAECASTKRGAAVVVPDHLAALQHERDPVGVGECLDPVERVSPAPG